MEFCLNIILARLVCDSREEITVSSGDIYPNSESDQNAKILFKTKIILK